MAPTPERNQPGKEARHAFVLKKPKPVPEIQVVAFDHLFTAESLAIRSTKEQALLRQKLGLPAIKDVKHLP